MVVGKRVKYVQGGLNDADDPKNDKGRWHMVVITNDTLHQLNALNEWLGDVYGKETRLSVLLLEAGLSEAEIEAIKANHLEGFLQMVVDLIMDTTDKHDGERRNDVMVRHYGLLNGNPETLQSIGDSLGLSRERIRQLVNKRLHLYKHPRRKEQFKQKLVIITHEFLNKGQPP